MSIQTLKTKKSNARFYLTVMLLIFVPVVGYYTYNQVWGGTSLNTTITTNDDLENGLMGHWTFDGEDVNWSSTTAEILDRSGNGKHGNASSSLSVAGRPGKIGQGLDFLKDTGWYDTNYGYCIPLTINAGSAGGAGTTTTGGFPLVATGTIATLKTVTNGGHIATTSFNAGTTTPVDVIITNGTDCDNDGGTILDFYFEDYASTTGAFTFWVEPDGISSTTDKTILMYYGNAAATNQSDESGVFGTLGEIGVWNLHEDPSVAGTDGIQDSTTNNNDGADAGSMTASDRVQGRVDGALDFDGNNDVINVAQDASFNITNYTFSVWYYPRETDCSSGYCTIFMKGGCPATTCDFAFATLNTDLVSVVEAGENYSSGFTIQLNRWYHLAFTFSDSANRVKFYVNGNRQTTVTENDSITASNAAVTIGANDTVAQAVNGIIDDARLYNRELDPADILTIYNNTASSSIFWTFGSEETAPSTAKSVDFGNLGSGVKTIAFWMNTASTTQKIINIDGTDQIELVSGAITATSFPASTIYVDGVQKTSISTSTWHHIVITDSTGVNASTFTLGNVGTAYYSGSLDDVRTYSRTLSLPEITRLYELGATSYINTTITTNDDLENGLVGHWTFDGKDMAWGSTTAEVRDRSSSSIKGNVSGFTSSSTVPGKIGQAIELDGANDYIDFGNAGSGIKTIAFWMNTASTTQKIINIDGTDQIEVVSGAITATSFPASTIYIDGVPSTSLSANKWHHIVITDSTGVNASTFTLGNVGTAYYSGSLDDVRTYSRVLSLPEITRLYELGATSYINTTITSNDNLESGLVGHWTFDGKNMAWSSTTAEVRDRSGNESNGNVSGFTATSAVPGRVGQAFNFDGQNDSIGVIDSSSLSPTGEITISSWFSPNETISGTSNYLQGLIDNGAYSIFLDNTDGKLTLELNSATAEAWSDVGSNDINSNVYALATYNEELYVGGTFINVAGDSSIDNIARWNGTSWSDVGSNDIINGIVNAFTVYNGDLYVGGTFTDVAGDTSIDKIARWNGTSWSDVGSNDINGTVYALTVYNGELYVGGQFTDVASNTAIDRLARWDGSSWSDVGSNDFSNNAVLALATYNGDLYVGGTFTDVAGDTSIDKIARWNGTSWRDVGSNDINGTVYALAVYNGELYVGGQYTDVAGDTSIDNIARWDGSSWSDVGSNDINNYPNDFSVYNGELYAGGVFTDVAGDSSIDNIARWNGTSWSDVGSNDFNFEVSALAVYNGELYAGGAFTDVAGNTAIDCLARWSSGNEVSLSSNTTNWPRKQWKHVVATYDGATARVYVDGILESSSAASITLTDSSHNVSIGSLIGSLVAGTSGHYFNGALDDVRVYNRALSQAEVTRLYELGS